MSDLLYIDIFNWFVKVFRDILLIGTTSSRQYLLIKAGTIIVIIIFIVKRLTFSGVRRYNLILDTARGAQG
jgi:hypothetical protein